MKLTLTTNDGVVLDETNVTRQDWNDAHSNYSVAWSILTSLSPGYPIPD